MTPTTLVEVWRLALLAMDGVPALRMRQYNNGRLVELRLDSCHVLKATGETWSEAFEALCDKLKALVEGANVREFEMAGGF